MLKRISKLKWIAIALVVIASLGIVANITAQTRRTSNNLAPQQSGNDAASVILRAGRDLITDGEWAKAQEKFSQYVTAYPNAKDGDVALFWMAYAQQKLGRLDQCRESINKLTAKYPESTWVKDARSLLYQTGVGYPAPGAIELVNAVGAAAPGEFVTVPLPARAITTSAAAYELDSQSRIVYAPTGRGGFGEAQSGSASAADDDPCEFKIVVLQALFQTDLQRGIVAATDWLRPNSGQTVRCKQAALSLLGSRGGKAVTPVILTFAQSETDLKLKSRAISALGASNDDTVIDPLRNFALNSQESEIVEAALYALSRHTSDRAISVLSDIAISSKLTTQRKVAINSIAQRPGEPAVDALLKIYDADQSLEIRRVVISGFGNRKSERAGSKLLDIARGSEAIELRKAAIGAISRRGGEKAVEFLLNLYDTEKNEELKDQILNSLGSGSNMWVSFNKEYAVATATSIASGQSGHRVEDQRVIQLLIRVAKDQKEPMERRKRAIGWLSRSKDPAVLKFLEELLK